MSEAVVRAIVKGRVQGVGFREWTCREADALGLWGWVRNRPDGSVELMAAGPEDQVQALLDRCREGPSSASVTEVDHVHQRAEPRMPDGAPVCGFLRAS